MQIFNLYMQEMRFVQAKWIFAKTKIRFDWTKTCNAKGRGQKSAGSLKTEKAGTYPLTPTLEFLRLRIAQASEPSLKIGC